VLYSQRATQYELRVPLVGVVKRDDTRATVNNANAYLMFIFDEWGQARVGTRIDA